jgi:hypothetical protein
LAWNGVYLIEEQMTYWTIDWLIRWKWYHYQFFWLFLTIGVPLRVLAARHFGTSAGKGRLSAVVVSIASSAIGVWVPIIPAICVTLCQWIGVHESLLIGVPLVGFAMAVQTAFIDAVLFRILLKETVKSRFRLLLIANTLNATIAFAIGLAWVAPSCTQRDRHRRQMALTSDCTSWR